MTRFYLDTSVAVHALFGDAAAASWFDTASADSEHPIVSPRILRTELTRVLRREGREVSERDEVLDYVGTVPLTEAILTGAESISDHLKTLDAIHLASLIACGADSVLVSHDANLLRVARMTGFATIDPVSAR